MPEKQPKFKTIVAGEQHMRYAQQICQEMEASAKVRGTGIAKRDPAYLEAKIQEGKAVIALTTEGEWAGFCYIESWTGGEYVANSGLIVAPKFREFGLASEIKEKIFKLSRKKFPQAKIFGLTTARAVMKINSDLGYEPCTYSELTADEQFWNGCKSCVNHPILMSKGRKNCLCTAMIYDPAEHRSTLEKYAGKITGALHKVTALAKSEEKPKVEKAAPETIQVLKEDGAHAESPQAETQADDLITDNQGTESQSNTAQAELQKD
jgi:hypothetical protein